MKKDKKIKKIMADGKFGLPKQIIQGIQRLVGRG